MMMTRAASLKEAVNKPLLKKPTIGPNDLRNYRAVSNLLFWSKVNQAGGSETAPTFFG